VAGVETRALTRRFGGLAAVERVDLRVADGEFVALLGPSGCGKTTLLRLVAGFEVPDEGEVRLGDAAVSGAGWALPPEERGIGMVFQSYALWPHMSVEGNVGFPLRVRRVPGPERRRRVAEALDLVGLGGLFARRPTELSGGQRQRVALARCLAMRPSLILLDEPLANLDAHLREAMQGEFRRLHRQIGATFLYVTHDQAEALALADRVAVMDRGRLEQVAAPERLYREPATEMVAGFIGRGMVVDAVILGEAEGGVLVEALEARFRARGQGRAGERRRLCLRPSDLRLAEDGIAARVTETRFQGAATALGLAPLAGDGPPLSVEHRGPAPPVGSAVRLEIADAWLLPGRPP